MLEAIVISVICFCMVSILWFTLKTGISPMPSSLQARLAILEASEQAGEGSIVDLGSGWGTLLFALARKYPKRQIVGYEISWLPWLYSQILKIIFRMHHVKIYRSSFLSADLSSSALLVCYLHPKGMQELKQKLSAEHVADALLISSTFALPDAVAKQVIRIDDLYQTPIYVYNQNVVDQIEKLAKNS